MHRTRSPGIRWSTASTGSGSAGSGLGASILRNGELDGETPLRKLNPTRHPYLFGGGVSGALIAGAIAAFASITAVVSQTNLPGGTSSRVTIPRQGTLTITGGGTAAGQPGGNTLAPLALAVPTSSATAPPALLAFTQAPAPARTASGRGGGSGGPPSAAGGGANHRAASGHQHAVPPTRTGNPGPGAPPAPGGGTSNPGPRQARGSSPAVSGRVPPGLAKKPGGLPPGLAKKPGGLPPGLAKKPGGLPPGLAKKRGGLPPGQTKKFGGVPHGQAKKHH
jgi:hypothetical protein